MLVVMDSIIHPVFILSPYQYEVRLLLTTHAGSRTCTFPIHPRILPVQQTIFPLTELSYHFILWRQKKQYLCITN